MTAPVVFGSICRCVMRMVIDYMIGINNLYDCIGEGTEKISRLLNKDGWSIDSGIGAKDKGGFISYRNDCSESLIIDISYNADGIVESVTMEKD